MTMGTETDTLSQFLIVADDMQFAHQINEILVRQQIKLTVAQDFARLKSVVSQEKINGQRPFDLVLLDLSIADLDGPVVLQWLRALPEMTDTPIIVLCALDDINKRVELIELGADDYLKIPFPMDELLARITIYQKLGRLRKEKRQAERQIRAQEQHLRAINAIGSMITQYLDLDAVLNETVQSVVYYFGCTTCAIYLCTQDDETLTLAAHSADIKVDVTRPLPPILQHQNAITHTITHLQEAAIPIIRDNVLLGVILIIYAAPIPPGVIPAIEILSVQLAIALTNIYLFQDIQESNFQLKTVATENMRLLTIEKDRRQQAEQLYNMAQTMGSSLAMEQVLVEAMNAIQTMIQVELGSIVLVNEHTGKLIFMHSLAPEPDLSQTTLEPGQGIVGQVIKQAEPLLVNDVRNHPQFFPVIDRLTGQHTRSILCVPLITHNHVIGAIELLNKRQGEFDEVDLKLVSSAATSIAIAIENSRLYQKQANLIEQLQQSQAQIIQSEKLAATGRLAASLAHEINNPLQAIHSCLQLATHFDLGPEKQAEYLGMAGEEVERLVDIVSRILDFARPSAGEFELANINTIISQMVQLTHKHVIHHNVTVEQFLGTDVPPIPLIPDQIGQVFMAIMLNAFDALANDAGILRITTRTRSDYVEAVFSDTGSGIDTEILPHIFEPFFSTKPERAGLGLTISFGIVERHGGQIMVESKSGSGSIFTVRLPRTQNDG
ncbi:MAG TPA: GAF domain-containing protein [Chloroflexota bacterium]|nr:GAF domain-containing protein [Chloroflexota bacterium]